MWRQRGQIAGLCTAAAVGYGVLHDQVTVRLSPAYFLVGHRPLCGGTPATVALCWGVAGTWWVGAVLGVILALVARPAAGRQVRVKDVMVGVTAVLAAAALASGAAGLITWTLAPALPGALGAEIPRPEQRAFAAAWAAHAGSYGAALVGGFVLVRRIWVATGRSAPLRLAPVDALGWLRVVVLLAAVALAAWRTVR
jgi:hypothetical protein